MIEKWSGLTLCATAGSLFYAEQLKAETVLLNSCSLLNRFSFFFFLPYEMFLSLLKIYSL